MTKNQISPFEFKYKYICYKLSSLINDTENPLLYSDQNINVDILKNIIKQSKKSFSHKWKLIDYDIYNKIEYFQCELCGLKSYVHKESNYYHNYKRTNKKNGPCEFYLTDASNNVLE